jgi:SAM-dependent methyltransferase
LSASIEHPYPPFELANRVLCLEGSDNPFRDYEVLGAETKSAVLGLLPSGWSFEGKRILDFGCGAGRTLRHFLGEAEDGDFWGTDIHDASVAWLEEILCPPLHAVRCGDTPPLDFESSSFDLVWAISVFTHLTDNSSSWLLELHRILKPGGLLIATYTGRWSSEILAGEPWDEDRVGRNELRCGQPWDAGGPIVLISDWWLRAHWGRAFEILEIVPEIHSQSWALLRKRDVELTAEDLDRPEDDPREVSALRHNVHQLKGELQQCRQDLHELVNRKRFYEESRSWRFTSPLRWAARLLRSLRFGAKPPKPHE